MSSVEVKTPSVVDASGNASTNLQLSILTDLSQLLLSNVKSPSYNLTQDQINWINQFIAASPSSFTTISSDIKTIVSGGQIGLQTIPQIVKLCADIYSSAATSNNLVNPANIIAFVKFTLDVILSSPLLVLPNVEKEVIQSLVDTSLTLLSMNIGNIEAGIEVVESSSCCTKFLSIFKC
jgi:hypothetical protein